jgi:anti-sigma factor RsiW
MSETCARFESLLSPYTDGELAPSDEAAVRAHVAACEACSKVVATHGSVKSRLLEARYPALAPEAARKLVARAQEPRQVIPWRQIAAAVIVAVLVPAAFALRAPRVLPDAICPCDVVAPEIDVGL